jgi:predicted phage-related endonuclease
VSAVLERRALHLQDNRSREAHLEANLELLAAAGRRNRVPVPVPRTARPAGSAAESEGILMATAVIETTEAIVENRAERRRAKWIEEHRRYIGGSEIYKLLNLAQYGTGCRTELAFQKLGVEPDFPDTDRDDLLLARGNILEPLVAMLYEQETGRKVRRPAMDADGMPKPKFHPEHPWAGVNTDRIILTGSGGIEETGDLEIKTRSEGPFLRVKRSGPFPGDILQPQWSLFVTGHKWGSLATLGVFGHLPLVHFDVRYDTELQEIFKREGGEFANVVWGKGHVPEPTLDKNDQRCKVCQFRMQCRGEQIDKAEVAMLREITKSKKELVQIDNHDLASTLAAIDMIKGEQKELEESLKNAQETAMQLIGDANAALVRGYGKVYKLESQAHYLDATRLKAEHEELYNEYYVSKKTGNHYLRQYPEKIA